MKHHIIFTFLAISAAAFAQQMPPKSMAHAASPPTAPQPSASDPAAPVPDVVYRSVFKETSLGLEKDTADWRKANEAVGKFLRGHVDILKWEEQEATKAAKPDSAKTAPSAAATPVLAAPSIASPATTRSTASAHKH